jgi:undecaprenyl-phosphate galactose phosphotransferase
MTGLWQVSGRSRVGFEKRVELDAKYAGSHSLWLDVKIILKTPAALLRREEVY